MTSDLMEEKLYQIQNGQSKSSKGLKTEQVFCVHIIYYNKRQEVTYKFVHNGSHTLPKTGICCLQYLSNR